MHNRRAPANTWSYHLVKPNIWAEQRGTEWYPIHFTINQFAILNNHTKPWFPSYHSSISLTIGTTTCMPSLPHRRHLPNPAQNLAMELIQQYVKRIQGSIIEVKAPGSWLSLGCWLLVLEVLDRCVLSFSCCDICCSV